MSKTKKKRKGEKNKKQKVHVCNFGLKNELRVVSSLCRLQEINPLVTGYHHSKQNGESDVLGIDVTIFLRNGFALVVQIKSNRKGISEHFRKHPNVPIIVANAQTGSDQIANILSDMINEHGKHFFDKSISLEDVYPKYQAP